MAGNGSLKRAKKKKIDEFYTRFDDINYEVQAYVNYDKDVFRNKTILMPCDDPFESNFFKFFALRFNEYGLKKIIATSFSGSPIANTQLSLFPVDEDNDEDKNKGKAYKIEFSKEDAHDINGDHTYNLEDVNLLLKREGEKLTSGHHSKILSYLKGDNDYPAGDFRSREVTRLRDESDVIATNPPFSLFRDFVKWIQPNKRKFLIIGSKNSVTYKEIFLLIQQNYLWIGQPFRSGNAYFDVPTGVDTSGYAKGVYNPQTHMVKFRNVDWFTNLDYSLRHKPLNLMSMKDNLKYSKHKKIKAQGYQHYDNYDAIEVPAVDAIPSDYTGIMGVPITYLDKYDPDQFKIIGFGSGSLGKMIGVKGYKDKYKKKLGNTVPVSGNLYYVIHGKPVTPYKRILIQAKKPKEG